MENNVEKKDVSQLFENEDKKKSKKKKDSDEFFNEKGSGIFSQIVNIALWVILIAWMGICIIDFVRAKQENKPIFTFSKKESSYVDSNGGDVKVVRYTGLGYRIFYYSGGIEGVNFGPFWSKDSHDPANKK